ncbi:hypothetical protein F5887DRAFT_1064326 [Amanita rubescens]|nr:hypothetical protein F5887DRAFT_1064326 [Amanita rubescens]
MPKRPRADSHSEVINSFFETLFAIANVSEPEDAVRFLKKLKLQVLSAEAEKKKPVHKAAKKFTLTEAVQDFGLTYSSNMTDVEKHWWKIKTLLEAKTFPKPSPCLVDGTLNNAIAQLVVYLACLRQSRANRGRCDASVYGLATDGLRYIFITITHEGVLKESNEFNIMHGNLPTVLGCLQYILEMAMSMCPNSTPEKGALNKGDEFEIDSDESIDLDDNPYLYRADDSDSDSDSDDYYK